MSQEPSKRRLAEERDLRTIFSIYMHKTVVPFLGFDPMPLEGFRPIYQDLLRDRNFFVYEVSGRLGGFYKAWRHPGRSHHVACIACLAVNPGMQGRGVARAMMLDAMDHLRAEGVKRVELYVESDNSRAIHLYTRLGFEVEGTLRDSYKRTGETQYVDSYLMALMLA